MKMLLASNDVLALQPVAKRLVTCGIPIALQKASDISSWLEIWIQRDGDFSLASALVPTGISETADECLSTVPPGSSTTQRVGAGQRGTPAVTSKIGRCLRGLRPFRQS
jgi:hypothetical protein